MLLSAALGLFAGGPATPAPSEGAAVPAGTATIEQAQADLAEPASSDDPQVVRARSLYEQGRVRFELGDYDQAIQLWSDSYELVAKRDDARVILSAVSYNLAVAQHKAFEIDRDLRRLRTAIVMMDQSIELARATDSEDVAELQAQREMFGIELEKAEAELADAKAEAEPEDGTDHVDTRSRGMLIGGSVSVGLGVAGLGVMGYALSRGQSLGATVGEEQLSLASRRDQLAKGYRSNALAIGAGVAGGVLVAAGAALIVVSRRKPRAQSRVHVAPGPGELGLGVGANF